MKAAVPCCEPPSLLALRWMETVLCNSSCIGRVGVDSEGRIAHEKWAGANFGYVLGLIKWEGTCG